MTRRVVTAAAFAGTLAVLVAATNAETAGRGHKPPKPSHSPSPSPVPSQRINGASVLFALDHPERDTDSAVAAGLNTIRIVNFLDEQAAGDPFDGWRWARVDTLIAAAKARGLSVLLDLSTYRNQRLAQGLDPYGDWSAFVSFAAHRYLGEPTIALIALAGEPVAPNSSDPHRPTSQALTDFYTRTAAQWHAIDPLRVVTSGGLLQYSWGSGIDWRAIFSGLGYCSVHVYSQADIDSLATIAAACSGMPLLIEEFGQPQSVGDSVRASYFAAMEDRARSLGAGIAFWNLGPELKADTYDVNPQTPLTWAALR